MDEDRLDLWYPESSLITCEPVFRLRGFLVQNARDVLANPLDPESFFRRPMLRRSRYLLSVIDLDDGQPKLVYPGSSKQYWADGDFRIALYEPGATRPYKIVSRGYGSTVPERIRLARKLKQAIEIGRLDELQIRIIADDLRRIG